MGYHMAAHVLKNGSGEVVVWNRTTSRSEQWATEHGGEFVTTIAAAVTGADLILCCLGRDEDVREVMLSEAGVLQNLKAGAVIVDHTTTSAVLARELSEQVQQAGAAFLDGPLSGGEEGAKNGALTCMLGGDSKDLARVTSILETYCKAITLIGGVGAGQLAKMVNQICIAGVLQGLSEGICFAEAEQLDVEKVLNAISGGAAQSWQMNNRANTMHQREFDFGFASKWMIKDLGYCLDQAQLNGSKIALATTVHETYQSLAEKGHQQQDTSVLILGND